MANDTDFGSSKYLRAFDPAKPAAERFDYGAFLGDIGGIAQTTRQVTEPELPQLQYMGDPRMQAAFAQYGASREVLGKQAESAATALEMKGASTVQAMQRFQGLEIGAREQQGMASEQWAEAVKKAGKYVGASTQRTKELFERLEEINDSIGERREFAKAHAMQAGVQSVLGSLETESRAIAEEFGRDSKEYQQFTARKTQALGTLSSGITVGYQQMAETQGQNYLNAVATSGERMAMYENFQEQMHIETMTGMATATQMYNLQTSQFLLGVEQLRTAGMDDIANWIIGTPVYAMDVQPLVTLMSEIGAERRAASMASEQLASIEKRHKMDIGEKKLIAKREQMQEALLRRDTRRMRR